MHTSPLNCEPIQAANATKIRNFVCFGPPNYGKPALAHDFGAGGLGEDGTSALICAALSASQRSAAGAPR
jgi:hypothetical protein